MIHSFTLYGISVCLWGSDYEQSYQPAQAKVGFVTLQCIFSRRESRQPREIVFTDGVPTNPGPALLRAQSEASPKRGEA